MLQMSAKVATLYVQELEHVGGRLSLRFLENIQEVREQIDSEEVCEDDENIKKQRETKKAARAEDEGGKANARYLCLFSPPLFPLSFGWIIHGGKTKSEEWVITSPPSEGRGNCYQND